MSRYQERTGQPYKSKYVEKKGPPKRFDLVYDPEAITFRTEIPPLPEKNHPKPDEKAFNKQVAELKEKYEELKEERKKKKNEYKAGSKNYEVEISELNKNIQLGNKCLIVLRSDLGETDRSINELEAKIQKKFRLIKNLQKDERVVVSSNKQYDQMTLPELQAEEDRLQVRISTASLNKKEQTEINSLMAKINRLKRTAQKGKAPKNNSAEVEDAKDAVQRLKKIKQDYEREKAEIESKMEAITDDLDEFQSKIDEYESLKRNPEITTLYEESKELKADILKYRDEILKLEGDYALQKHEFEYQQEKIKWIKWATEEKEKKIKEWEAERAQRYRQKQKAATTKQGEAATGEEGLPERRIINKYQRQIDGCTFLIQYCNSLIADHQKESKNQTQTKPNTVNLETVLQKGEWAKEKGIEVIKSKKDQSDEGKQQKVNKKKRPVKKEEEEEESSQNFTHNVFTQNVFDSVKVFPPVNAEEVSKTLAELQSKLEYFLEHPEGPATRFEKDEKPKYTAEKFTKARTNKKPVINTEDFPAL